MRNFSGGGVALQNYDKLRREYLARESAIAAFGWFFIVSGVFGLIAFLGALANTILAAVAGTVEIPWAYVFGRFTGMLLVSTIQLSTGFGFRKLQANSRIPGTFLGVLLSFYGIGIWLMILLWSKKGNMVFSDEYRAAVQSTPYIRRHMTATAWILIFFPIVLTGIIFLLIFLLGMFTVSQTTGA